MFLLLEHACHALVFSYKYSLSVPFFFTQILISPSHRPNFFSSSVCSLSKKALLGFLCFGSSSPLAFVFFSLYFSETKKREYKIWGLYWGYGYGYPLILVVFSDLGLWIVGFIEDLLLYLGLLLCACGVFTDGFRVLGYLIFLKESLCLE